MKKFTKSSIALIVVGLVVAGGISAALLLNYVTMTGTVNVQQSVVLDDGESKNVTSKTYIIPCVAGNICTEDTVLKNLSDSPATVELTTDLTDNEGIGVTYSLIGTGNSERITVNINQNPSVIPANFVGTLTTTVTLDVALDPAGTYTIITSINPI